MCLLAELNTPSMILLGVALLVSGALLFRSNRYFARQARPRSLSDTIEEPSKPEPKGAQPPDLQRWEVEMHELARELSARLDCKMSALQHLIQDADRAAARLEQAMLATRRPDTPAAETRASEPAAGELADAETPAASGRTPNGYQQRYEEIYMLADYGYPVEEVAQRVGSPIGEVQLILSLRKRR